MTRCDWLVVTASFAWLVAFGCGGGSRPPADKVVPVSAGRNDETETVEARKSDKLTIITSGKLTKGSSQDDIRIIFDKAEAKTETSWSEVPIRKHFVSSTATIQTNGGIIESQGPTGTVIEVLGPEECAHRFPEAFPKDRDAALKAGLFKCIIERTPNGGYKCENTDCEKTCKKKGFPVVHCKCE
jgi:hypothetical protein